MRLDKPVGIWLLLLPSLLGIWSVPFVEKNPQEVQLGSLLYFSFLFSIGAIVMRSAGCVINDFFDRNIDQQVERTQNRPLASGVISPLRALWLFAVLMLIGFGVLIQLPLSAIYVGLFSIIPVILYPLMKRITFFPQFFLGVTYNLGVIIGFLSLAQNFHMRILWLYFSGVFLTVAYDTIYAFQDIKNDLQIDVKSTAIIWQKNPKMWIMGCYMASFMFFAVFFSSAYALLVLGLLLCVTAKKLYYWDPDHTGQALYLFKMNVGLLVILLAIVIFVA